MGGLMTSAVLSKTSGMKNPLSNLPEVGTASIGKVRVGKDGL
jgi:hypothetical protein